MALYRSPEVDLFDGSEDGSEDEGASKTAPKAHKPKALLEPADLSDDDVNAIAARLAAAQTYQQETQKAVSEAATQPPTPKALPAAPAPKALPAALAELKALLPLNMTPSLAPPAASNALANNASPAPETQSRLPYHESDGEAPAGSPGEHPGGTEVHKYLEMLLTTPPQSDKYLELFLTNLPQFPDPPDPETFRKFLEKNPPQYPVDVGLKQYKKFFEGLPQPDPDPAAPIPPRKPVKEVLADCDADLRWAFSDIADKVADKWKSQLANATPNDLESHRVKLKTEKNRKQLFSRLLKQYTERKTSVGRDPSTDEIQKVKEQIRAHDKEIMNHVIDIVFKLVRESDTGDGAGLTPEKMRKVLTRTLRLIKQGATCYELLGVKPNATTDEIKAAARKLALPLHPDKNKDKAALTCSKAVNAACTLLKDEDNRAVYDAFLRDNPPPERKEVFDEDMAPNAFGDDDVLHQSDSGEDDSEDDEEAHYPSPSKSVRHSHDRITPRIKALFKDLSAPLDESIVAQIVNRNNIIQRDNQKHKRINTDMYTVPTERLLFYRFAQRRIAVHFQTGLWDAGKAVAEGISLLEHFHRTRSRGLYQWPEAWADLIGEPLDKRLRDLGVPDGQQPEVAPEDVSMVDKNSVKDSEFEDSEDEDSEDEDSEDEDSGDGASERGQTVTTRPLEPLRAGYTMLGDKILGYMPLEQRSRYMPGQSIIKGFRLFVMIKETGLFKVATGEEVGGQAALEYHQLPEGQKNDIRNNAQYYSKAGQLAFEKVLGVTWFSGSSQPGRLPVTYVWVAMKEKSRHAHIMTRTTFRQWLGHGLADKFIDSWLVDNGITPEWALLGFPTDPANNSRYLSLTFPAPRHPRYDMRPHTSLPGLTGYPSLPGVPSLPNGHVEALTRKFDELLNFIVDDRKEERAARKQQQELMMRLLPAPI